jgi:small subunit ribosomal protein S1
VAPREKVDIPSRGSALDAALEAEINAALEGGVSLALGEVPGETPAEAEPGADRDLEIAAGTKVKAKVLSVHGDSVIVDIGARSSGVVPTRNFEPSKLPAVGAYLDVVIEKYEAAEGLIELQLAKASVSKPAGDWHAVAEGQIVDCMVTKVNKGGLEVSVSHLRGFLPAGQVDLVFCSNLEQFVGQKLRVKVMEVNPHKKNLVVSRRSFLEIAVAELREEAWKTLEVGQKRNGKVKTLKDYGAFVDIGGVDGLVHVSEISWGRVTHPRDVLSEGQDVEVVILSIDKEKGKIGLGMKQLQASPWQGIMERYPPSSTVHGKVTKTTEFGAFVELEPGVEGLVHVSEMSWTKKNVHPGKIVSTSQEVEVQVLEVDPVKRRISLGLKQTMRNPWEVFVEKYPSGTVIEGEVKNKTEFGLFLGLDGDVDGMVHLSDLDWKRPGEQVIEEYKKGDKVKATVLDVDVEKERISLGIKQLGGSDPMAEGTPGGDLKKGDVVTCEVMDVKEAGLDVKIAGTDLDAFIRRADLARDRGDQRTDRFQVGQKVDARVTQFDRKTRKISVSIKALEMAEEKEAIAQYGSSDSGATLGDILGTALKRADKDKAED